MSSKVRPTKPEVFMSIARTWATLSTCSSRVAVGCVLVNQFGQIIASGYNGSPRGFPHCDEVGCMFDIENHCIRAIHAEMNAILQCARTGVQTNGCDLYVTHSPCSRCAMIIAQSGISHVIYGEIYKSITLTEEIFKMANIQLTKMEV